MENFHQHFSSETIKNLEILQIKLQNAAAFSDAERLELFRTLHTVKGGSQTFGFTVASRLAHELENLLAVEDKEFLRREDVKSVFAEGINGLVRLLQEKNSTLPTALFEKIRALTFQDIQPDNNDFYSNEIPAEISSQLSFQEKNALISSLNNGKILYVFEINFDSANFAGKFKEVREILSRSGEIFASIPSEKFKQAEKIGFQIVFTSLLPAKQISEIARNCRAEFISDYSERSFSNNLSGLLARAVEHGKKIAEKLSKRVEFVLSADEARLSTEELKLIFDSLLHLIRNAVDHAIEEAGKIEIILKVEKDCLKLSVADDGRGIDAEKIKSKAIEKKMISADASLSEQETLDLIFMPEFSTASELTEISGRGIGLDAVKNAVEKADGKINVKSAFGMGTTFEIFLPTETGNRSED